MNNRFNLCLIGLTLCIALLTVCRTSENNQESINNSLLYLSLLQSSCSEEFGQELEFLHLHPSIRHYAGSGNTGYADGFGSMAEFQSPSALSTNCAAVFLADAHRIRRVSINDPDVTTIYEHHDTIVSLNFSDSNLYFMDATGFVYQISETGASRSAISEPTGEIPLRVLIRASGGYYLYADRLEYHAPEPVGSMQIILSGLDAAGDVLAVNGQFYVSEKSGTEIVQYDSSGSEVQRRNLDTVPGDAIIALTTDSRRLYAVSRGVSEDFVVAFRLNNFNRYGLIQNLGHMGFASILAAEDDLFLSDQSGKQILRID